MAEPLGNDQAGKRPAQTIEGTATEVSVEPAPGAEAKPEPEPLAGGGEPSHSEGEAEAQAEATAAPPPPRERKSFMTHLAAGLLGGLIGVIGLAVAWGALDLGKENGPSPDIADLKERLTALEAAPPPQVDTETLTQLEGRIAALEVNSSQTPEQLTGLENGLAQLQSSLKTLAETANEGGSLASAAATAQQIAEAEQRLNEKIAAASAAREKNAQALADMQSEIAALKAKFGALAEAELGGGADVGPELNALSERIAKIETLLPDIVSAIGKETADAKTAAAAIAFANLRAAVNEGSPYAAELDTLGALAHALGDLGILPAYAEKGIPTVPELARSFTASSDKALAAAAQPAGNSFLDRMMASAQSLVTVRRIDETPAGEGAEPALARAKAALDKGELAVAVKEVETLDGPAREAFSAWLGAARARLAAGEIMTRLEGALLISMGGDAETQQP
jgi:hypothetical protein